MLKWFINAMLWPFTKKQRQAKIDADIAAKRKHWEELAKQFPADNIGEDGR